MMCICGLRLRGILFLQALVGIVRMQVCQQEKHLAITALTGGDVKFVSDHYNAHVSDGSFHHEMAVLLYRRQQLDTPVATILPGPEGGFFYRQKNRKKVSGNVFMKKVGNSTNIFNFNATITIHNLSETDSDVYMLYRGLVTLGCWSVYVLDAEAIVFEPNRTSYVLPVAETLKPIKCLAYCNSTCQIKWTKEDAVISNDTILQPGWVLPGTTEYVCHVENTATGKKLRGRIFIYGIEQTVEFKTLVYVFASLTGVFALVSTVLAIQLWRHGSRSGNKSRCLQRNLNTETVEMDAEPVAASAHDDNTDRPEVTYEDLRSRSGQENTKPTGRRYANYI